MRDFRVYSKSACRSLSVLLGLAVLFAGMRPAIGFQLLGVPGQGSGLSLGGNQAVLGEGDRVPKLEAGFTKPAADGASQLFILATVPAGAHIYSITQPHLPDGTGPIRTAIKVDAKADVRNVGNFLSVNKPDITHDEDAFPGLALEAQEGTVKWIAPIQLAAGTKPEAVKIEGKVHMQLCDAVGCAMPKDYPFTATYRPDVAAEKLPATPAPSTRGSGSGRESGAIPAKSGTASSAPAAGTTSSAPLVAPSSTNDDRGPQSPARGGEINWLPFTGAADLRTIVNPETFDLDQVRKNVLTQDNAASLLTVMFWGFVGGLILNVMPCVLPVIGLKVLSFVQQSGHNRGRALMLNVCYSLGLLLVFVVLAFLAILFHLGWGELFGMTWFKITLAAVVFVMALSFMGIWEVPLPTFLGGGKTGELAAQEGMAGAFFKGVLTTFLATPCSAPLLAPAVAWATSQPAPVTLTVFLFAGLGMASPYLLIGAFPELVRFLPKPGAWMETFKQFMGFVLMGTVVYLLAVLKPHYVVPTTGLLFALSFTCWLVGRTGPEQQEFGARLRTWVLGAAVVGIAWIVMFPGLDESVLGRFHFEGLAAATAPKDAASSVQASAAPIAGPNTVLIDFTASWCQNCHFYENTVLNTAPVIERLRQLGVVTLKADWSDDDPKVSEMLDVLGSRQVPVIAVFSASEPNRPTIFRGTYTQQQLLDALAKAGPSPRASVAVR